MRKSKSQFLLLCVCGNFSLFAMSFKANLEKRFRKLSDNSNPLKMHCRIHKMRGCQWKKNEPAFISIPGKFGFWGGVLEDTDDLHNQTVLCRAMYCLGLFSRLGAPARVAAVLPSHAKIETHLRLGLCARTLSISPGSPS